MSCLPETEAAQNFHLGHWSHLIFQRDRARPTRPLLRNGKSDDDPADWLRALVR